MHHAKAATPAFVSTVFQIIAFSARCPTHAAPLETKLEEPIIVGWENEFVTAGHASHSEISRIPRRAPNACGTLENFDKHSGGQLCPMPLLVSQTSGSTCS